jgi:DNA-binding Xre family transcriptional regulator
MIGCMDAIRLGTICRALRIKKRWRQIDLAHKAAVSEACVSRLERAKASQIHIGELVRVVDALGGQMDITVRWQGGDLDRLLNARHSALHESVARWFSSLAEWTIAPEVSFSIRGERGVIDILAWHAPSRTLLVIELKTEIVDFNELMGTADRKRRLAPLIARDRGWLPQSVALWVIVADSKTNRRRVQTHATTLRAAFPLDGRNIGAWMRKPSGRMGCLSFWTNPRSTKAKSDLATMKRVRRPRKAVEPAESRST